MPRERKLPSGMCKRGRNYYARFRAGGRLVQKRLSGDLDTAKVMLNDLRARADKAEFGLVDNNYPWADLKAEFIRVKRQTCRIAGEYETDLGQFEEFCKVRSISQVTNDYVAKFRDHRLADGISPRTINKQVAVLRNMLNKAVEWGHIGSNPISGMKPLPDDNPTKQRRALAMAEVEALLDASPEYLRSVWRTFMTTGLRKDELVELMFSDFDEDRRELTVRAEVSKTRKARSIPLDDETFAMIARLRKAAKDRRPVNGLTIANTTKQAASFSRDHIFVTNANTPFRNNLLTRFYMCCKRAGIADGKPGGSIDIHSLRGSFITLALEGGASPKAIQEIVGHSTLDMTMNVYARATDRSKRDAIGALPFAKMTAPAHLVAVQAVSKVCASAQNTLQVVSA